MTELIKEEIKEVWEWCGFKEVSGTEFWSYEKYKETNHWYEAPNGRKFFDLPEVDLNNLFKYAVPKTIDKIMEQQECDLELATQILFEKWQQRMEYMYDFANPLFRAIQEVIHNGR